MIVRSPVAVSLVALAALLGSVAACARRPVMCAASCDPGFACASGECLRAGAVPQVEGLDRFGLYQTRRVVLAPVEIARLSPGDAEGVVPAVATLGRDRDAASILLLRFAVDLPPGTSVVEAHVILERAPALDADSARSAQHPSLHAARIVDPWDARSISWGRSPRLDGARYPSTVVGDGRQSVRIDVQSLVQRWRLHLPDDQGIAILAEGSTPTGMAFAVADGRGSSDDTSAPHVRGPRLELYVKP